MAKGRKGETFIDIAKEYIKLITGELQPYTSEKITVLIDSQNKVSFFTPAHMQFAKYGRGPGKQPPLDSILDWVKEGRIQFRDAKGRFTTYEGTAWAIAKSIAKKGTANWVPGAPNALEEALEKGNKEYLAKLAKFSQKRTLEELQLIYQEQFPPVITIKR